MYSKKNRTCWTSSNNLECFNFRKWKITKSRNWLPPADTYTDLIFLKYKFTNIKDWKFNQYPCYKGCAFLRPSMAAIVCLLWWATNRRRNRKLHNWHKITNFDTRSLITTGAVSSIGAQNTNCPVLYCTSAYSWHLQNVRWKLLLCLSTMLE